jgi:N-hydroxyarylamine O-acetyltransferase
MRDVDAYLQRIGLHGTPGIAQLHLAHCTAIPFEALDPQMGRPVSLGQEELEAKLVARRRGGYCFEQNLLFKGALEALGMQVDGMLARVKRGAPAGVVRPRSHLVLRVLLDGERWLADVGLGLGTLLAPLPFDPGDVYEQSGWRFRVVTDQHEHVLQTQSLDGWVDLYGFPPQPVPMVDIEVANWFTSSHPRSPFVTGLIVGTQTRDGLRTSLSDWGELALTEQTPAGTSVTPLRREAIPELLATRFSLPGFALGADGRLVPNDAG